MKRIGILTSGGDCQGLNAAIRGVGKTFCELLGDNVKIFGIQDGYKGLIEGNYIPMKQMDFSGILTPVSYTHLGGTSDIPVAEEAAVTAELCGSKVNRIYDIGVSGIHRLIDALPDIRKSNAVVAVAGMEGALASVLAGQIDKPVIAVPTSIGYGANLQGISADVYKRQPLYY